MKLVGGLLLSIAGLLLVIYSVAWVALVREHGPADAVRIAVTLWPGNVIGFAILSLALACGCGGAVLVVRKE